MKRSIEAVLISSRTTAVRGGGEATDGALIWSQRYSDRNWHPASSMDHSAPWLNHGLTDGPNEGPLFSSAGLACPLAGGKGRALTRLAAS